ncbi:MAG TPA: potassium channel family protein [Gemmatimonadaceae bacterium]|nr:potassium channel family protein [Gemmatimonadaceae bacterium]
MGALSVAFGIAVVLLMLRDVVHELFDPDDTGALSRYVMHGAWRLLRRIGRRWRGAIYHAGPAALMSAAVTWTAMLILGGAFVYWPHLPAGFNVNPSLPPEATRGFATALYVSMATSTTLGSSDIVPVLDGLRYAGAIQSLVGVVLITAWITWVLSIYPVLAERRAFAREVERFRRTQPSPEAAVRELPHEAVTELMRSLTEQVLRVNSQLSQTRVTYYFQNRSPELALAIQLPYVLSLARAAEAVPGPDGAIRSRGALLRGAVESLCEEIGTQFLDLPEDAPPERVIEALAADHLLDRRG